MRTVVRACAHCGAAVEAPSAGREAFCCTGCEHAAAIIRGAGLERYYTDRSAYPPRPITRTGAWDSAPTFPCPDGSLETRLAVDGLRCASCVWVTERVLAAMPGVVEATVSYATGRTHVRWDGERTSLAAITDRIAALGYAPRVLGEEAAPDRGLLTRLGLAVFAAMNVMLIAVALYAGWFSSMDVRFERLFEWATLVIATPVALWCAEPFYRAAWNGLKHRSLHMDVPISIAVIGLYIHGLFATLTHQPAYLDSLTMLVALLLVGRVLESRGRRRAAEAATTLAASLPSMARRVSDDGIHPVPAESLLVGDLIEVAMGEEICADGTVTQGAGCVIMAVVTGESVPVGVGTGDSVVAGGVLESGAVTVRVEAVGSDTVVSRMADAVAEAASRPTRVTATDALAPRFTAATLAAAAVTFIVWGLAAGLQPAVAASAAVLVVACPCALALSRPLAGAAALGAAARRGTLFRSSDALLDLATVDTVALDKTGTLTGGELVVVQATDGAIRIGAGLERSSIHPVARAIVREAGRRSIPVPESTAVVEEPGRGVVGVVAGQRWSIESDGPEAVVLSSASGGRERIRFGDAERLDSRKAVEDLEALGLVVALLTGDDAEVANRVAARTGVQFVGARMSPEEKADWIRTRRERGKRLLFVGDGVNDGPALAASDVGLSMRSGAASTILIADGVVASSSLRSVVSAIRAARVGARAVHQNQRRSIAYNVVAVLAAMAGLINPLTAAVLMPLSSAVVVLTASGVERRVRRSEP